MNALSDILVIIGALTVLTGCALVLLGIVVIWRLRPCPACGAFEGCAHTYGCPPASKP